jgi:RNA polymerase sigma-70 factor (ECF subfamily)
MKRTEPDTAILARVSEGDAGALTELYERYGESLFAFLYRLAGDKGTAEEILQDTLLAVWRSARSFQGRSKVSTWLFGVARRQAHNRLRGLPPPAAAEARDRADARPGPEELAVGGDWLQATLSSKLGAGVGPVMVDCGGEAGVVLLLTQPAKKP